MADTYSTLLREEKLISYGATLTNIVPLGKETKMKKIVISVDGLQYDPIEVEDLKLEFVDNTITLSIVSADKATPISDDTPTADGFEDGDIDTPSSSYPLQGNDLEAFTMLSGFRKVINKTEKLDSEATAITIESATYNIQDSTSVQNSNMDLMDKEREFLDDNYKVFSVSDPRFVFEDRDNFKLIETAVLYKVAPSE